MSKNNVKSDRDQILEKLEEIAKGEGVDVSELAANLHSQMDTFKDKAKDKAAEVASQVKDKAVQVAGQVDEKVKSRPWWFIGAAAAFGFWVGKNIFRRKN